MTEYVSRNMGTATYSYPKEVRHSSLEEMVRFEQSLMHAPTGVCYSHYEVLDNYVTVQTVGNSTALPQSAYDLRGCAQGYEDAARKALPKKRSNHVCTPGPGGRCPICRKPSGFHR